MAKLAARSGHTRLSTLGVEADDLPTVTGAVGGHPLLANTLSPPDEQELAILLQEAL